MRAHVSACDPPKKTKTTTYLCEYPAPETCAYYCTSSDTCGNPEIRCDYRHELTERKPI